MPIVSVLWSIGLLTMMALSLLWNGNISYRLARNSFDTANISAMAEAIINRAVLGVSDGRPDRRWRTDGVAQNFEFGGIAAKIFVQDELGRIDLNHADAGLLASLFRSAGLDPESASGMADKVLDWREAGNLRHLNGAKEDDYRSAGYPYRPRNGAFQSVDELLLVMGMGPGLFKHVEPALTVYSGRQFVDPQVAPREALLALPAMDPARVAAIMAARSDPAWRQASAISSAPSSASLQGRAFAIRAELGRSTGVVAHEAVIRLTGDPAQPYLVLNWKTAASAQ
jgi:general secretion pathway protein K